MKSRVTADLPPKGDTTERRSHRAPRGSSRDETTHHAATLRSSELECLNAIAEASRTRGDSAEMLETIAQVLPGLWPGRSAVGCLLEFDGAQFGGACPSEDAVSLREAIRIEGRLRGQISVYLSPPDDSSHENPSEDELVMLLSRLARALGGTLATQLTLEEQHRELEVSRALARVSNALIATSGSLEEICSILLESARALTGSHHGFVAYVDKDTADIVSAMYTVEREGLCTREAASKPLRFPKDPEGRYPHLWGHALNTGKAFFTNDPLRHPAASGVPLGHFELRSFLAAPAMVAGNAVGQICLANAQHGFCRSHLDVVMRLAELLGFAVHRKQLEDDLQRSERRFRGMAECAQDLIWRTDPAGRVLYVNPVVSTLLGYEPEDAKGIPLSRYMTPSSRDNVRHWLEQAARSPGTVCRLMDEVDYIHRDGTLVPAEILATAEFDDQGRLTGFQGISRDIRQRRRADLARREGEVGLRAMVAHMPIMLQAFDDKGLVVAWNRECEQVTGFTASEIVGNPDALALLYPDELQRKRVTRALASQGTDYRGWELEVTCKNGRTRTIEWSSIAKSHPIPGWATWGLGVDVSDLRQAWEERRVMDTQLAHQQRLHSLGTLAAGVAHEINNPANVILNYAQLIVDAAEPGSTVEDDARQIISESQRIARIVRSLHSFTRTGSGRVKMVPVRELIESVMSVVRVMLTQDSIAVETDVPDELPDVPCQTEEVQQILLTLVHNSRDALNARFPNPDEDKRLSIRVRAFASEGRPWVRLTVEDRGVGIPEEIRPRVFDPFFSTKPRAVGTGLGLYIAHRLVSRHGGAIEIESELAKGTRFHVDLPASGHTAGPKHPA